MKLRPKSVDLLRRVSGVTDTNNHSPLGHQDQFLSGRFSGEETGSEAAFNFSVQVYYLVQMVENSFQ